MCYVESSFCIFFFQAEDGIRDRNVTGVQTCALPIFREELGKDLGELLVRRGEGLLEALARGAGELGDRAPEVVERALEVGPLCDEELAPRAQLLELAGGGGIDVAEACEPRAQRLGVLRAFRVLAVVLDDHV